MIKNASPSTVAQNPNSWSESFVRFGCLGRLGLAMFFSPFAIAMLKHGLDWLLIQMKVAPSPCEIGSGSYTKNSNYPPATLIDCRFTSSSVLPCGLFHSSQPLVERPKSKINQN